MRARLVGLVEAAVLLALGLLIVGYAAADKLKFFVNLSYSPLIVAGGAALIVLALAQAVPALEGKAEPAHRADDGHDHDAGAGVRLRQALWLAVPVLLALAFAPRPLSSETAAARGIANDLPLALQDRRAFQRVDSRTLYDWVMALNLDPEPDHYRGDAVDVEGFVMRAPGMPPDDFVVAKFVIACCAADARPVGIAARAPAGSGVPPDGAWVRVRGAIEEMRQDNERRAVVAVQSLTRIAEPADPYLY